MLADGQKLEHTATADMDVDRPHRIRVVIKSARSQRELSHDGKTVTLNMFAQKYYSTVDFTDTVGKLIDPAPCHNANGTCAVAPEYLT